MEDTLLRIEVLQNQMVAADLDQKEEEGGAAAEAPAEWTYH